MKSIQTKILKFGKGQTLATRALIGFTPINGGACSNELERIGFHATAIAALNSLAKNGLTDAPAREVTAWRNDKKVIVNSCISVCNLNGFSG